jgi:glycosyltransferase involved in cell wall biosynthesis
MRIGIDCRMYSSAFTGIGRYVFELVQELQKIDTQNQYFLFINDPIFSESKFENPNFHKVLVNAKHYSVFEQTKFLKILNQHHLDLMHFTHFNAPIFYFKPSVVTIHDLTLHFFPGKKMTSPLHRLAYNLTVRSTVKKARNIIAVSQNTANDLQKLLKTPKSKIQVIYEGVTDEFYPVKDHSRLHSTLQKYQITKPFLLYTGVWRDHKNVLGLIDSFKKIRQQHDIQLVITGKKDTIYAQEVFAQAGDLLQNNQIVFPGLVSESELVDLLTAAEIFVYPSFYEGFGLPPLEAMKCGTAVAASNASCIPESCGDAAIYFDPYNINEMAEKISHLYQDKQLQATLIGLGFQQLKKYSWEKMANNIHQLYLHGAKK